MRFDIFPFVFGRKGGLPFEVCEQLKIDGLEALQATLFNISEHRTALSSELSDLLFVDFSHGKKDKRILNLRRDVFNDRKISENEWVDLAISDSTIERLEYYNSLHVREAELLSEFCIAFDASIGDSSQYIFRMAHQNTLKNAILFSSPSVSASLSKQQRNLNTKKGRRLISTLLNYLMHSTTKTSPFSTLNSIFALKVFDNCTPLAIRKSSILTLNRQIFFLFKDLLTKDQDLFSTLFLHLNPTIETDRQGIDIFVNERNNEAFKRVARSPVLDFILSRFQDVPQIAYTVLSEDLKNATGQPEYDVCKFVQNLVNEGILMVAMPMNKRRNGWLKDLKYHLESNKKKLDKSKNAENLRDLTNRLLECQEKIETVVSAEDREIILSNTYEDFKENISNIYKALKINEHSYYSTIKKSNLFFDDYFSEHVISINEEKTRVLLKRLGSLSSYLMNSSIKLEKRKQIIGLIKGNYTSTKVPLLDFYRDIYLKYYSESKTLVNYQKLWIKNFARLIPSKKLLSRCDVDIAELTSTYTNAKTSYDLFGQFYDRKGDTYVVVNNLLSHATTNISRFASAFKETGVTEKIVEWSRNFDDHAISAEIIDNSAHTVNTFEPVTDYVIDVALGNNSDQRRLDIRSLSLKVNNEDEAIIIDNSGRKIVPLDYSLESISRRSSLMQFLDIFGDSNAEGISPLLSGFELLFQIQQENQDIVYVPRLLYGEEIVLSRRKWIVSTKLVRNYFLDNKDSECKQFIKFNQWIKSNGIPEHLFIKLPQQKPFYINSSSPIFFRQLIRSIGKHDFSLKIEEMIPSPNDLPKDLRGNSYVQEHIFSVRIT